MNYPHPIIAREGWPFIAIAAVVALLVHAFAGFGFAWLFWLILIFVVQFFRDPARPIPTQANAVLCPADGRIVAVETAHDPYANREALKISVFMNVFNVHSQRSPVDGAISKVEYFPGAYLNAAVDKASTRKRAQCGGDRNGRRPDGDVGADRRSDRAAHSLLRTCR